MSQLVCAVREAAQASCPSISSLCRAVGLSRATFYRYHGSGGSSGSSSGSDNDMDLRHQLQQLALAMPGYGYRRMTAALRRQGLAINHKRVLRLMREDNLLCVRRKRWIRTTDSSHRLPTYPNLVPQLQINGPNQLWVADITYIRLLREWVYLAVLLDAWSRRCIGWALERHLEASLATTALQMALETRSIPSGLVHHSDQGVQYAAREYVQLLQAHEITSSMSRRGNCYDNAQAESFLKTLKYEEVYLQEYAGIGEARNCIGYFIEEVYNRKRLHSALDYVPPTEFEQAHIDQAVTTATHLN